MAQTKETPPYKSGEGGYNRESGKKTLVLVAVCIAIIVILSLLLIFFIIQQSRVMII